MAWVTNDGEYNGSSVVLEFKFDQLTPQQWENLEEMADVDRYEYVSAVLADNDELVRSVEMDNFGEEWGLSV
jgi:hypothetical protein